MSMVWVFVIVLAAVVVAMLFGFLMTNAAVLPPSDEPPTPLPAPPPPTPVVTPKPKPETVTIHLQNERGRPLGTIKLHKIRRRPTFQYRTTRDGKLGNFMCVTSHSAAEYTYRRVSVERE